MQFAGGPFLDIGFQHDAIRRGAGLLLDVQLVLEEAKPKQAILGALHLDRVEGIPFGQAEFAADHIVVRDGVAVDRHPFDIDARHLPDLEGDVHRQVFLVAVELRAHIGKGIAQKTSGFRQAFDGVFNGLRVVPIAFLHADDRAEFLGLDIAQLAFQLDLAELVALTLFHDIGDNEVLLVGRELGHDRGDAEIGIAFGQIILPQFLLVVGQTIGIIGVVGGEEAPGAGLFGSHLLPDRAFLELGIAQDVDLADLGFRAFADLEDHIDAVLFELHNLGLDTGGKAAAAAIEFKNAAQIGAGFRSGEDLARREADFLADLLFLHPLGAFDDDPVDHRIFLHLDDERAIVVADGGIGKQFGGIERLERGIERITIIAIANGKVEVGADRFRFQTLGAAHDNAAHDAGIGGSGRQRGLVAGFRRARFGFSRWTRRFGRRRARALLSNCRSRQRRRDQKRRKRAPPPCSSTSVANKIGFHQPHQPTTIQPCGSPVDPAMPETTHSQTSGPCHPNKFARRFNRPTLIMSCQVSTAISDISAAKPDMKAHCCTFSAIGCRRTASMP